MYPGYNMNNFDQPGLVIGFEELIADGTLYGEYLEDARRESAIVNKYIKLMDNER